VNALLRHRPITSGWFGARRARSTPAASGRPPGGDAARGRQHRVTLRFLDPELERVYQRQAGREGLAGFRIITGTAALAWPLAALIIPLGTPIPREVATPICFVMGAFSLVPFLLARRVTTLDRQHLIASILTTMNALVVLALASAGRILPGYGVAAILMLFAFGFVSRTGFVFAAVRTTIVGLGFLIIAALYEGGRSLLIDAFIFGAAITGTLMALRLLEQSRRRVFFQDVVIGQQGEALRAEKARSDGLLANVIPARIASRLMDGERGIADAYPSVTVLFADIVGFTALTSRLRPDDLVDLLDRVFTSFDALVAERGLEKIKTIGDAYMVAGGLPEPVEDHAGRTIDLALRMIEVVEREGAAIGGLRVRIGVHTGPVVGGVLGHRRFAFDIWGETVNMASRLESHGVPNRVHLTDATLRLVRDRYDAEPLGSVTLKGYGPIETFAISGARG
jgi:class 3 adenylate cyclase